MTYRKTQQAHADRRASQPAPLAVGSRTDVGCVRENNEDNLLVAAPLYAVADGMGGHAAGEVASEIAIQILAEAELNEADPEALRAALVAANKAVIAGAQQGLGRTGMGTTMTAAIVEDNRLVIAQVGDSRAYLLHAGHLRQVTRDHSLMAELIALGEITPAEARTHAQRSVITRVLGSELSTQPDLYELDIVAGDRLLLCSDGLTAMVEDEDIERLLKAHGNPQRAADALVELARGAGGYDNITLVIVDIEVNNLREQKQRRGRARRAVVAFVLAFVLLIGAIIGGFGAVAYNSYFVVSENGVVVAYRGFRGEFLGMKLRWPLEGYGASAASGGTAGTGSTANAGSTAADTPSPLRASDITNPVILSELEAEGIKLDSPEQVAQWFAEQSRRANR